MDKTWIQKPRNSIEYKEGVIKFINFAFEKVSRDGTILCPCKDCVNCVRKTRDDVIQHLMFRGILTGYTKWLYHGESVTSRVETPVIIQQPPVNMPSNMHHLLHDAFGIHNFDVQLPNQNFDEHHVNDEEMLHDDTYVADHNEEPSEFYKYLEDANQSLYPGCDDFSILSFIVKLLQIKCRNKWSDNSVDKLLQLLKAAFPHAKIPSSFKETKKVINALGLSYEKIHVCPNNCILYWGERANEDSCNVCNASRWKLNGHVDTQQGHRSTRNKKKVPAKVLRYFPLKPRLQRLYMSSITSSSMRWHNEGRQKDGILRHPADSLAWRSFDERYPHFAADPRNVRLGLASDGFNPFGIMSNTYSIWPVILMPYNLPPWMCMRQESFILSMIIPGEKGPGNNIDVFLQPLIAELLELWEGVETYDASSKQTFRMRAALMWTINDFPAYAYLSGWSTKGKTACPCCADNTDSRWLRNGKKHCYLGHRRWLSLSHNFRSQKHHFDGTVETRPPPIPMSGADALRQLEGVNFLCEDQLNQNNDRSLWKKKSIFFKLPYWEHHILRHNLDVMHIEKNVCENVIGTLLNIGKKKKENENSREDMALMDIRPQLHPQISSDGKRIIPPACYHMSRAEKDVFLKVLKDVKVPDGYCSNISRGVNIKDRKLQSLKSHDYHILMQGILPIALRSCMNDKVTKVITELSVIFKAVCSKALNVQELEEMESRATLTLCHMERIFPPSFFTIMVHLVIHIVAEAKVAGPVHYRWMYPIERCLKEFKQYVGNKAQPEGSIAERYVANECLTFCSRYIDGTETIFNRPRRNPDVINLEGDKYLFGCAGKVVGAIEVKLLDEKTWVQAHRYVLFQHEEVTKFREEFKRMMKRKLRHKRPAPHVLDKLVNEQFHDWFKNHVPTLGEGDVSKTTRQLAIGPNKYVKSYKGMIINGTRFYTKERNAGKKTQNTGVIVRSQTTSYASVRDQHPIDGDVDFFGELTKIVELDYYGHFKVVLFRCDWADVTRGVKKDEFGFTLVNFSRLAHTGEHKSDDPFILSSQAQQVFYVQDLKSPEWCVAVKVTARDVFDVGDENLFQGSPHDVTQHDHEFDDSEWVRTDITEDIYMQDQTS